MRTDLGLKKLANMAPVIGSISSKLRGNEKMKKFISEKKLESADNTTVFFELLPVLFDICEDDIYKLISVAYDKSVDEVKSQELSETFEQGYCLVNDMGFSRFFKSVFSKSREES